MNLNLSGHHVTITPGIRGHVNSKLERITRHFDHVINVSVILSVEKLRQKAEATVHVRGKEIYVENEDEDLYVAIDHMAEKLDRSILKYKDKLREHPHDALKHHSDAAEPDGKED
jgi:putative sigma-54 modulation protein